MTFNSLDRKKTFKPKHKGPKTLKRKRDDVHVGSLEQAVSELDPKTIYTNFAQLPLSDATKSGLKASHFTTLTDIQAKAIPAALKGADILGAAKTGSGKTLAFLIPVLENLYRDQCIGPDAGLGAMIIAPTRELAIQIFEVLHKLGRGGHLHATGLIIGGKSLRQEQDALARMNIVVCTPGRMLQHLSQTASFSTDSLKMLVLDEADRILDMGFQKDVDAIIDYLPKERQTMLFSATQTKRISDLARLSLQNPEYISVHQAAEKSTPQNLKQHYILVPLSEKMNTLWSFIQSSKKSKILVFLSSAKQVRFVYESFCKMQPGISLMHIHGRQKQTARMEITNKFAAAKMACLFATDVAARGLDFPAVDWVVQVDCPEDADTYIHRVGRTARYNREGRAVLFLDPSEEEGMLNRLEHKRVPIESIKAKQKKQQSITNQLANLSFKDPQLKYLAQKAFSSYTKSIYIQKDKEIFQLAKLGLEEYATSLGLPGAPRIKFLKGDNAKELKNAPRRRISDTEDSGDDITEKGKKPAVRTKYDRMFERRNQDILTDHYTNLIASDNQDSDSGEVHQSDALNRTQAADDTFLTVKRRIDADPDHDLLETTIPDKRLKKLVTIDGVKDPVFVDSKRAEKRLKSKKSLLKIKETGSRVVFDDQGVPHPIYELENEEMFKGKGLPDDQRRQFIEDEAEKARKADIGDKELAKAKKREKREKRREKERKEAAGGVEVVDVPDGNAYADFVRDAESVSDEAEREAEPPKKRKKKWFEEDEGKVEKAYNEPETLEDLETLAQGLLE